MTEAMPFLRKLILLSYDPRPFLPEGFACDSVERCDELCYFAKSTALLSRIMLTLI